MKKLIFLLSIPLISFGQSIDQEEELPALRLSNNFSKPYRVLKTTISDKSLFQQNYKKTNLTLDYVIRYHFYTSIDLSSEKNQLISMDRSTFTMPDTSDSVELIRAAISEISDMSYGSQENDQFITKYFDGCIDLTKVNKNCIAPTVVDPVCGCDGFSYNNSTLAECSGLISYSSGSCD